MVYYQFIIKTSVNSNAIIKQILSNTQVEFLNLKSIRGKLKLLGLNNVQPKNKINHFFKKKSYRAIKRTTIFIHHHLKSHGDFICTDLF